MSREERRWFMINVYYCLVELLLVVGAVRACYRSMVLHAVSGLGWTAVFCPALFALIWMGTFRLHTFMLTHISDADLEGKEKTFDQFADLNLCVVFMPLLILACWV